MSNILIPKIFGQLPSGPFARGLVFYWRGIRAGNVVDESYYGNHGTINGATWVGNALNFSVGLSYVECPTVPSLPSAYSAIIRVKTSSNTRQSIIDHHFEDYEIALDPDSNRILVWFGNGLTSTTLLFTGGPGYSATGQWQHIAVSVDKLAGTGECWVDGVSLGIESGTPRSGGVVQSLFIGNRGGTSTNQFKGTMSDVKIYNRVLSASEIAALYLNPNLPMQQPPIWLFMPPPVVGAVPKGPLGHPLYGPFAGPIVC